MTEDIIIVGAIAVAVVAFIAYKNGYAQSVNGLAAQGNVGAGISESIAGGYGSTF